MSGSIPTIDVTEVLASDAGANGIGYLNLGTTPGTIRLKFPPEALADLPYVAMSLLSEAKAKAAGPGIYHTYILDRLDVIEDVTLSDTLILRFVLEAGHRGASVVFEFPSEVVDQLADGIAALRQQGAYAQSSKSSH
jgi:hypothetical protein